MTVYLPPLTGGAASSSTAFWAAFRGFFMQVFDTLIAIDAATRFEGVLDDIALTGGCIEHDVDIGELFLDVSAFRAGKPDVFEAVGVPHRAGLDAFMVPQDNAVIFFHQGFLISQRYLAEILDQIRLDDIHKRLRWERNRWCQCRPGGRFHKLRAHAWGGLPGH